MFPGTPKRLYSLPNRTVSTIQASGTDQGTATPIATDIAIVVGGAASSGIRLPKPSLVGQQVFISVTDLTGVGNIKIYPHNLGFISDFNVNVPIAIGGNGFGYDLIATAYTVDRWSIIRSPMAQSFGGGASGTTIGNGLYVYGTLTAPNGAGINTITSISSATFDNTTGNNKILFPDNLASGFWIGEGSNRYLDFVSTNGVEGILANKNIYRNSATIAAAGANQTNATAITSEIVFVNTGSGLGVRLPTPTAIGQQIWVFMTENVLSSLKIYPNGPGLGHRIGQMVADDPVVITLPADGLSGTACVFTATSLINWMASRQMTIGNIVAEENEIQGPLTVQGGLVAFGILNNTGLFTPEAGINMTAGSAGNFIKFPDNLAEGWWVGESTNRYISAMSSNGLEKVQISKQLTISNTSGITAKAGGGQDTTFLIADVNVVTVTGTAHDSVTLPVPVIGMHIYIFNQADKALDIFPSSGTAIDSLGANAAYPATTGLLANTSTHLIAVSTTKWCSQGVTVN